MRVLFQERLKLHHRLTFVSRFPAVMIISALLVLSLSGCSGTQPQKTVPDTAITQTPENVARVFAEAVFRGDCPLMFKCYPTQYTESLSEEVLAEFDACGKDVQAQLQTNAHQYVGTSSQDSTLYSTDKTSSLYQEALNTISTETGVSSDEISDIRTCIVQVYFSVDGTNKYQNVQVLVYKYGVDWFAFDVEASTTTETES